jgi:dienelactone hydrolase
MRSRSWCSALVLVALVAGCGSGSAGPFADPHAPLRYGDSVAGTNAKLTLHKIVFAGANRTPVYGYLVTPRKPGRYPAVLFLHGSGGTSTDFLDWADAFAQQGGVAMTIQQPNDAASFTPLVVNARRALDALQQLKDVDRSHIGVMGFSLGAQTAAIVAGVDHRPKAVVLMSGRGDPMVLQYVRKARGTHFLVEYGTIDEIVPQPQLKALARAVPQPKQVRTFVAPHTLVERALVGQIEWLRTELR